MIDETNEVVVAKNKFSYQGNKVCYFEVLNIFGTVILISTVLLLSFVILEFNCFKFSAKIR